MADQILGVDPTRVDTVQAFPLGSRARDPRTVDFPNNELVYVKAISAISTGNALIVDVTSALEPYGLIPSSAVSQVVAGIAHVALPVNNFGWVTVKGRHPAAFKSTNAVTAGDTLSTSATAGALALANSTSATALAVGSGIGVQALDTIDSNTTVVEVSIT